MWYHNIDKRTGPAENRVWNSKGVQRYVQEGAGAPFFPGEGRAMVFVRCHRQTIVVAAYRNRPYREGATVRIGCLVLTLFLAVFSSSQSTQVLPERSSIKVTYPEYVYQDTSVASIRLVKFGNIDVIQHYDSTNFSWGKLKNGRFEKKDPVGYSGVWLERVAYLDAKEDKPKDALVQFSTLTVGGSTSNAGMFQVFEIDSGNHLRIKQQIRYDTRGAGRSHFNAKTGVLTVRSAREDPHCCPVEEEIATFKWDGSAFQLLQHRTVPIRPNDK